MRSEDGAKSGAQHMSNTSVQHTRARMMEVAERLVAELGVEAVSLRMVGMESGQRNNSAAQYHFGSKEGLIDAVITARSSVVDGRRQQLVDRLAAAEEPPTLTDLVRLLVVPLAEMIGGSEERTWYLRFLANVMDHPALIDHRETLASGQPALHYMRRELRARLPQLSPHTFRRRNRWMALVAFRILAEHERELASEPQQAAPTARVVDELVDMLVCLLQAPGGLPGPR